MALAVHRASGRHAFRTLGNATQWTCSWPAVSTNGIMVLVWKCRKLKSRFLLASDPTSFWNPISESSRRCQDSSQGRAIVGSKTSCKRLITWGWGTVPVPTTKQIQPNTQDSATDFLKTCLAACAAQVHVAVSISIAIHSVHTLGMFTPG